MNPGIDRQKAVELLKKYNKDSFHLQHAYTVEGVMRWFANNLGFAEDEEFWAICGLLHDIDFELYPDQHCKKAPELLEGQVSKEVIHAVCSHGYGICSDVVPSCKLFLYICSNLSLSSNIFFCILSIFCSYITLISSSSFSNEDFC